jgi:hypothetical protein
MAAWLACGLALYFASAALGPQWPAWQTVLYKLGHVTTLAWVGYWIARQAIGRLDDTQRTTSTDRLARAVVMAGVIIAGSLGL